MCNYKLKVVQNQKTDIDSFSPGATSPMNSQISIFKCFHSDEPRIFHLKKKIKKKQKTDENMRTFQDNQISKNASSLLNYCYAACTFLRMHKHVNRNEK